MKYIKAEELNVQEWLNTKEDIFLEKLKGKVIVIFPFQMLCPACVQHTIPQCKRFFEKVSDKDIVVLALHTVFENHNVMNKEALEVFIDENRLKFPIAIDLLLENEYMPETMKKYAMQGTPTLLVIDQKGNLRLKVFGIIEDLELALIIGNLSK